MLPIWKRTIWRRNNLSSAILIQTNLRDAEGWKGGGGDLYGALMWGTNSGPMEILSKDPKDILNEFVLNSSFEAKREVIFPLFFNSFPISF